MISEVQRSSDTTFHSAQAIVLVRYGAVPEVARFTTAPGQLLERGHQVVVETHRGHQLGTVLERLKPRPWKEDESMPPASARLAIAADLQSASENAADCEAQFDAWCARIVKWNLNLELIDLEWTIDRQKLILYVLCERGPDSTKLALQAAASGMGIIEVQPVSSTGLVQPEPSKGSCGSGGCGCSH